jgi:hypothetical protein
MRRESVKRLTPAASEPGRVGVAHVVDAPVLNAGGA